MLRKEGWFPVIAHAERYHLSTDMVKEMKKRGCYIQINVYSIVDDSDEKIRKNAEALLKEKLVDFVGTDAHRTKGKIFPNKQRRDVKVENGIDYLYKEYPKEYVKSRKEQFNDLLRSNTKDTKISPDA